MHSFIYCKIPILILSHTHPSILQELPFTAFTPRSTHIAQPSGLGVGASAEILSGVVKGRLFEHKVRVFAPSAPGSIAVAPKPKPVPISFWYFFFRGKPKEKVQIKP